MKYVFLIIVELIALVIAFLIITLFLNKIEDLKIRSSFYKIGNKIYKLKNKYIKKDVGLSFIIVSFGLFSLAVIIIYSILKIFVASLILSIPFLFAPYIYLKVKEKKDKDTILRLLPLYALNLKNNMNTEENIVLAMKRTKTDKELSVYIDDFLKQIDKGLNLFEALQKLKYNVNIAEFSELIDAIYLCYKNGGKLSLILEIYSKQLTKKIMLREKEKEKSLSSIITLIVMICLNIFLLIGFVFKNEEFAFAFKSSILGRGLIDINCVFTVLCMSFLLKIYKMEE